MQVNTSFVKMYATPYKYARLCNVSTQAIYQRIKSGQIITVEKIDLNGEKKDYIDLNLYPPSRGRKINQALIYFLIDREDIVYIGVTKNLTARLRDHKINGKIWDSVRTIPVESNRMLHYERRLVRFFKPRLNKILTGNPRNKAVLKG